MGRRRSTLHLLNTQMNTTAGHVRSPLHFKDKIDLRRRNPIATKGGISPNITDEESAIQPTICTDHYGVAALVAGSASALFLSLKVRANVVTFQFSVFSVFVFDPVFSAVLLDCDDS